MNWLAHIFLSERNIDFQIGNYLADPLKGRVWETASDDLIKGMSIHKLIDSYTDAHEMFNQSKIRLGDKGLLKPIIIDLTYDYLLTKNWDLYSHIYLDEFLQTFYTHANKQLELLPQKANTALKRLIEHDILNKYRTLDDLKIAFERVDKRLSERLFKRDQASSYFETVSKNINDIENDFLLFFPQLCDEVRKNCNQDMLLHWRV